MKKENINISQKNVVSTLILFTLHVLLKTRMLNGVTLIISLVIYFQSLAWFGRFYGISTFVGYLTPNPFLCK